MTARGLVVAIDGPAGSGKSTVAKALADRLGVPHVDTGAYYRAATLVVIRAGVDPDDESAVAGAVEQVSIDRVDGRTLLAGEDVEEEIRGATVTGLVSTVSAQPAVRSLLLSAQRAGVNRDGGVVEGRDIGTRVAPDADLKVWLDADVAERGRRRALQAGEPDRVEAHIADLGRRDAADAAQMVRDPDAVVVDTTGLSLEEVIATLADLARNAARPLQ